MHSHDAEDPRLSLPRHGSPGAGAPEQLPRRVPPTPARAAAPRTGSRGPSGRMLEFKLTFSKYTHVLAEEGQV